MKQLLSKHSLPVRLFHWINFGVLAVMIWSGLLIYWANDVYRVGVGHWTILHFFPDWFYNLFNIPQRLAEGMAWHFFFMWFFAINGLLYVGYVLHSGDWRSLAPDKQSPSQAWQTVLYDLRLTRKKPPQGKYNGAQRIAYTTVILMGFGSLLTGLAIYKPIQLGWLTWLLGGYVAARLEHFWLMIGFVLFFLVHVTQVMRAGWNNFQAIVTGVELAPDTEPIPDGQRVVARIQPVELAARRKSRRSFLAGAIGTAAAVGFWEWLCTRRSEAGIPWPLRRTEQINEGLWRGLYSPRRLAPTFALSQADEPQVTGDIGLSSELDPDAWHLKVVKESAGEPDRHQILTMDQIRELPRVDIVTEHKCIEGWSRIVHWSGARMADFVQKYGWRTEYVSLSTPDGEYYVGLDMASALHPQTLLCYGMNGAPLEDEHGAPLRLVIPIKYGIKSIKRIGVIRFSNNRPKDYWAEQGYDWYAGH